MANTSRVNGFKPVKHQNGSPYNGQANIYEFAVGESVALFVGDAVLRSTEASTSGYVTVKTLASAATANDVSSGVIQGVVVGILNSKVDPVTGKMTAGSIALDTPQYAVAGVKTFVLVADAIDLVYEIQSTASYALADIGLNADVGVLAFTTSALTTGNSAMYVNATSPTASASRPLHVIGYAPRVDNEAPAANQKLLVQFTTHASGNAIVGV
tara:strand:+ start:1642 stop:2280 length:639 start_codon:yes stop_codon:yes gene_type:complete